MSGQCLIRVLSLQGTARLKARSAADDLEPFFEDQVLSDVTQRVSRGSAVGKEKSIILDLIRDAQELDPQCRRICSQLRDRIPQDPSLALAPQQLKLQRYPVVENGLLVDTGRVSVPPQEAIRNQLLETFHDCLVEDTEASTRPLI